jgi:hypothetical protein
MLEGRPPTSLTAQHERRHGVWRDEGAQDEQQRHGVWLKFAFDLRRQGGNWTVSEAKQYPVTNDVGD